MNFFGFARRFIRRKNPIKIMANEFVQTIKDILTINKKIKMAHYRLSYHKHQLNKMETLIAKSNEHAFLKGRNINEIR